MFYVKKENIDPEMSPHEVEEIYKAIISRIERDLTKEVTLPLLRPCDFQQLQILCSFNMSNCAKILQDKETMPDNLVHLLLSLYAGLVDYNGERHTTYNSRYYSALPSLFFKFAYKARVDSGYCLLER